MALGKRKRKDDLERASIDSAGEHPEPERALEPEPTEELEGPFDIEDFDDPATA
jgi:hypothetical protein